MKIRNIPETVTINDGPYAGKYTKRQGSRNDRTLSCWFGEEMDKKAIALGDWFYAAALFS